MAKSRLEFHILPTEIVTRMTTAMSRVAKSSRQGLGAGTFGFMVLALSLNQLCDLGQVTSLLCASDSSSVDYRKQRLLLSLRCGGEE